MPLLLIPSLLLCFLALLLLLWPLGLWQRYRSGRARRRARPGWVTCIAAGLLLSSALLMAGAVFAGILIDGAAWYAGAGLHDVLAAVTAGLWLAWFEAGTVQLHYTAN